MTHQTTPVALMPERLDGSSTFAAPFCSACMLDHVVVAVLLVTVLDRATYPTAHGATHTDQDSISGIRSKNNTAAPRPTKYSGKQAHRIQQHNKTIVTIFLYVWLSHLEYDSYYK